MRTIAVRVLRAYRTTLYVASCVEAGTPPWELAAEALSAVYWRIAEVKFEGVVPLMENVSRHPASSALKMGRSD